MAETAAIARAWEVLCRQPCDQVCQNAPARLDTRTGAYVIKCFGHDMVVSPATHGISGTSPVAIVLLGKLKYFFELAVLWYLAGAKAVPLSGRLIRATDLKAGIIFASGSHTLPLDPLARKYGDHATDFRAKGAMLGARDAGISDLSLILLPFPRMPVTITVWKADEEFDARVDLLFDSSCESHLPQDVLWATAMLSALVMM